ncbi:uncharacterized protein si:ch211-91p5.3 isoform X2 [Brienomyrus brachyistius]|uniref:uncharacterized protein si:ch211-91p5.3 isoform X2 n=1 Tax=Brienomyrus brachyistius TaxID=42636 RepID=UPI0020B38688|nr:uncharacterized protein si:ch211-91p5.3 isoform X2 [Brienomyrus brachyistius]
MALCNRFKDENYKNWLKTTLSLQLLRHGLGDFIEKESETYHSSLRKKLGDAECTRKCQSHKDSNLCETCKKWREEIFNNHKNKKGNIYWENCEPYKWSTDKWEVAKVYMPKGNKKHNRFEQFDISAVLNFISFCNHFNKLGNNHFISMVTYVRNQMMHSPDMKVAKKDMEEHFGKIFQFVRHLQGHVPGLQKLPEVLEQLQNTELSIIFEGDNPNVSSFKENIQTLFRDQKIFDVEQQIFKEKLQFLTDCLEKDKQSVEDGEIAGIRAFLEENKDLLEQLAPQVQKLNEIQAKVDDHEQQLSTLTEKVGNLEKKASEPVFSADVVKYKNHVLEEATKRNWKTPQFSEKYDPKGRGYIGQLEINGHKFEGKIVQLNKIAAHQEVARMALEQLDELSKDSPAAPSADRSGVVSSAGTTYFSSVTVHLNAEAEGHGETEQQATESAYQALSNECGIKDLQAGKSYKGVIQQHFLKSGVPLAERLDGGSDGKAYCKLTLSGPFTFQGEEGSTKKKDAEQQAAKAALCQLAEILGVTNMPAANYKGALKEAMEAKGLNPPEYAEVQSNAQDTPDDEAGDRSLPAKVPEAPQDKATGWVPLPAAPDQAALPTKGLVVAPQAPPIFNVTVKVPVKTEFSAGAFDTQEDAAEGTYRALAGDLALGHSGPELPPGGTKQLVLDFFSKASCKPPVETNENTQEGKFKCTLAIHGDFTFQNQEGASTKKQAEQEAAKEALTRLSRVLGWNQEEVRDGNYKGQLKELLDKQKKQPTYQTLPGVTDKSYKAADALSLESCSAEGPVCEATASVSDAVSVAIPSDACSQWPSPPQKSAKIDCPDIRRMLGVYGLNEQQENLCISSELSFGYKVQISFQDGTLRNQDAHMTKKDAKRKLYLEFAKALSLGGSSTEEHKAVNLVKEYFKRHTSEPPSEDYETKADNKFVCSLTLKSFCFSYESRGSSEEAARQEASRLAFSRLAPLLGDPAAVSGCGTEAEEQLKLLLQAAGQSDPVFQPLATQHKATARLSLRNLSLGSRAQNKSSARSGLCSRILGLLGEEGAEASSKLPVRNQLDDWFKKQRIEQPKFENTQDGVMATFSALLTFSHPEWENSWKDAESRLRDVMKARFRHLSEDTN